MKHLFIYLFLLASVFFAPTHAQAAFVVKKQTTAQTAKNEAAAIATQISHPDGNTGSSVFLRMLYNGTIGLFATLFGILGFFMPIFAIGAIVFGYIGIGAHIRGVKKNRSLAILGLVLGLIAIVASIAGGFAPLAIF